LQTFLVPKNTMPPSRQYKILFWCCLKLGAIQPVWTITNDMVVPHKILSKIHELRVKVAQSRDADNPPFEDFFIITMSKFRQQTVREFHSNRPVLVPHFKLAVSCLRVAGSSPQL
jgi:hypothetical protein